MWNEEGHRSQQINSPPNKIINIYQVSLSFLQYLPNVQIKHQVAL